MPSPKAYGRSISVSLSMTHDYHYDIRFTVYCHFVLMVFRIQNGRLVHKLLSTPYTK